MAECMDPKTARTWTVNRHTCEACRVMEAEQDNDTERVKQGGQKARGQKYTVSREE